MISASSTELKITIISAGPALVTTDGSDVLKVPKGGTFLWGKKKS